MILQKISKKIKWNKQKNIQRESWAKLIKTYLWLNRMIYLIILKNKGWSKKAFWVNIRALPYSNLIVFYHYFLHAYVHFVGLMSPVLSFLGFTIEFLHSYNTTKLRYIASCPCVLKSKRGIVNFDMSNHYSTQAVLVFMKLILSQSWFYLTHSIMINKCDLVMLIREGFKNKKN